VFLLSDGAATWGEANQHALVRTLAGGHTGSVFAYQTGLAGTDNSALARFARETGGAVFSVTGAAEVAKASIAHRSKPWRLLDAKVIDAKAGTDASDILLAGRPRTLFPGQTLLAVGRGTLHEGAKLELAIERDGKRDSISVPLGHPLTSELAPRAYGEVATGELEDLEAAAEPTAKAFATHFRVTGRTCSLLMLESEADYERFGIKPEHDTEVVMQTQVAALYAKTMAQVAETLGNPKAAFIAMIDKLQRMPGVTMTIPASYRAAIQRNARVRVRRADRAARDQAAARRVLPQTMQTPSASTTSTTTRSAPTPRRANTWPATRMRSRHCPRSSRKTPAMRCSPATSHSPRWSSPRRAGVSLAPPRVAGAAPLRAANLRVMAQALADMGKLDLASPTTRSRCSVTGTNASATSTRSSSSITCASCAARPAPSARRARLRAHRAAELTEKIGVKKADVVVTITWNTDNTDVDLHVIEPSGEECFYGHRSTRSGGELTRDVTQGYGPEMYVLPTAPKGEYRVSAHYFASDRNRASARHEGLRAHVRELGHAERACHRQSRDARARQESHAIATLQR